MARRTKEDAVATRQALLQAGLAGFSRVGYAAARLDDIAREAGVTRGALYWHFASKADLYTALVADATERIERVIGAALAEGGSFVANTRRVMVRMLAYLEEDGVYRETQALLLLRTGLDSDADPGRAAQERDLQARERQLSEILRAGVQMGQFRADLDPVEGARAMLAYLDGIMTHWLLAPNSFSVRASAPALVDIYIRGIAATPGADAAARQHME